ncbi:MAG: efflux RND transporter periplasmic adaptor subunit [Bacteroidales bacterium]|jgi:HlyD family secretion protein|nr:efflux RND transporter periplasmic adaptor subunit [Bacteroidales bacterium]
MKRKNIFITGGVLAAIVVTLLSVNSCRKSRSYTFETAKVEKGSVVNTVTATGTLEAITSVVVGTQVSGIVERLYVDFNSPVKKGQVLAELDKTALRSGVQQSLATLENAKAEAEYQASNHERSRALREKNLIAQADYDQAKYNYDRSKATLKNSQAQYDKALVQLGYATIYSPIDGVVMNRAVDEGQTVAASFNTPEIFTIAQDLTQMQVEADIDESDIGMIREGQRVEFDVDAFPGEKFTGTVEQIRLAPVTTSNVVTYTVIINAPNPDQKLLPGMTANIVIYVEEIRDVLTVPYKAVKFAPVAEYLARAGGGAVPGAGARTRVWVRNGEELRAVPIEAGSNDGDNLEVKTGLNEGDEVVIYMSVATAKDKKEKAVASNPFMPTPPGRRNTQGTSRSGANTTSGNR